jgi:hypothetical protein
MARYGISPYQEGSTIAWRKRLSTLICKTSFYEIDGTSRSRLISEKLMLSKVAFVQIRGLTPYGLPMLLVIIFLAGCTSFTNYRSDHFDPGHKAYDQFVIDDRNCQNAATNFTTYDARMIEGSTFYRHRMYNRTYSECMQAHGYTTRSWLQNILP